MKFYFLASLIILVLIISHNLRRSKRIQAEQERSFWEREALANQVRRKPLDDLNYVKIPLDSFPLDLMNDNEKVAEYVDILKSLSEQPIVNLTGYTNTDLKLEYGVANLTALTEYDQNYTLLVRTLQQWADTLYKAGYEEEACRVLEFAVSTRTDVSGTYSLLAEIYLAQGRPEKIQDLKNTARDLHSLNRNVILRRLDELKPG